MNFFHIRQYLPSKALLFIIFFVGLALTQLKPQITTAQVVEETLDKDDLVIDSSLPWGIKRWPYSKVIEVLDLSASAYGRIVIDRFGIDESLSPIKQPFSRTKPGKLVFASIWGSNLDGCYVETIVQAAPKNDINPEETLPTLLEIGVGNRIVKLTPRVTNPEIISYRYSYLGDDNSQQESIWHMNHRIFDIDADVASKLISAPVENVKARMHFGSKTVPFEIGVDTVERWQDIFSFNSTCKYVP
ncbi:hypothetical protein I4641_17555 [Waterburya agarophytonicola K14]|uniref:Uncharacterized protein n=1 Tax=Waterburya agarophytonicola KI4 TaxID=2874699 RepID=A0A964FGE5_9CYAN|nr:hypothetical protein [Waterburya agarophytonicola]MCC0178780.1 hypothetical protein [Waterburya agarophytonicola KI4]